jgi:hypothetical protein
LATYLAVQQHLPVERAAQVLGDGLGAGVSQGRWPGWWPRARPGWAGSSIGRHAADLRRCGVGVTGLEPVTSSL